jgi:hypothetical protein
MKRMLKFTKYTSSLKDLKKEKIIGASKELNR